MSKKIKASEGYAAGRDIEVAEAPSVQVHSISGGTNIIGNQGGINIQVTMPKPIRHRHPNKAHVVHELHLTILCK